MTPEELHQRLRDPQIYPFPTEKIELRETHVSCVYLADQRVYKIKKPVNLGFLDFTTLESRHHFCLQEVLLNRRFAPDTYLGVIPIRLHDGAIILNGTKGEIIEYAVEMRRLPEERMLDQLLECNDPDLPIDVLRLASSLAQIHQGSPVSNAADEDRVSIARVNWEENFKQVMAYAGATISQRGLDLCRNAMEQALKELAPLIRSRHATGRTRDVHGDLHADHICLTYPISIYDCIEFNRRFRVDDILADLAFLLMDLDKRGRADLGLIIEQTWSILLNERIEPALLRFYKIYRAFVRGKVHSFLVDAPALAHDERHIGRVRAREYFNLALGYLAPQTLYLTCGTMGSGKTTLSHALARAVCGIHLRSDLIRKELSGLDPQEHDTAPYAQGIYTPQITQQTYAQLFTLTQRELTKGHSVIVDAAFSSQRERDRFRQLATESGLPFVLLHLSCDETIALQRLERRWQEREDPSDGRPEIFAEHRQSFSPPVPGENAMTLDSERDCLENVETILVELLTKL